MTEVEWTTDTCHWVFKMARNS